MQPDFSVEIVDFRIIEQMPDTWRQEDLKPGVMNETLSLVLIVCGTKLNAA